jgi:hypothetical protein
MSMDMHYLGATIGVWAFHFAPLVALALILGGVRRSRWTLPLLSTFLVSCLVAVLLVVSSEDSYYDDGGSVWSHGEASVRPVLAALIVVAAGTAAASALGRPRGVARVFAVAGGWAIGLALLVVTGGFDPH